MLKTKNYNMFILTKVQIVRMIRIFFPIKPHFRVFPKHNKPNLILDRNIFVHIKGLLL